MFLITIRDSHEELLSKQIQNVTKFQELESSNSIFDFLKTTATEIAKENYERTMNKQNSLIQSVKEIVQKNISNPDLSLKWIASKLLYMNEDYLGKVISRETGGRFSQYVLNKRMELAQHLIATRSELKVSEISKLVGFSEDAQYFSKVFKKYTGLAPSEYKKTLEEAPKPDK
ncbi:HTH-type transcriptional regulator YesS [compost metagenome]